MLLGALPFVVPGGVPWTVDAVRSVVGPAPIAWLEDRVYGARDALMQKARANEAPKELWTAPAEPLSSPDAAPPPEAAAIATRAFPPPRFQPISSKFASTHDGVWLNVADDVAPDAPPVMAKASVHPDTTRPYAVVAVLAMYLPELELNLVAGTREPESDVVGKDKRPGKVPAEHAASLVAAFNGGWQAMHGHFGMMLDGDVFLPPRDRGCTVAMYKDGLVRLGTWTKISPLPGEMRAYRQGPRCLVEAGASAGGLKDEALGWGASVDGETVIRRSALGLSEDGQTLFFGMGDDLTARTVADALARAGAKTVMELDINASFPRFLMYAHDGDGVHVKEALMPAKFSPGEYVAKPWYRDFFYVRRRPPTPH